MKINKLCKLVEPCVSVAPFTSNNVFSPGDTKCQSMEGENAEKNREIYGIFPILVLEVQGRLSPD